MDTMTDQGPYEFPDDYRPLFDVVVRVAGQDETRAMLYRVDLVDLYSDGPDVPTLVGTSPIFSDLSEAMGWAARAVAAFRSAV
jgi:hypothetical protein